MFNELLRIKSVFTMRATYSPAFMILLNMFVQIRLLCKIISAVLNRAQKWLLILVNPHVIKQIMPLPKEGATLHITDEYLRPSVSLATQVPNEPELFRFRKYKLLLQLR